MDAAERGATASRSDAETKDLLKIVKVFKDALLAKMAEDDVAGIMTSTYVFRDGKPLGAGVVLTLSDRALFGWMKGIFKKPVIETVPLSSITAVKRGVKASTPRMPKATSALFVKAGQEWEFLCSPYVAADAPLYGMLADLLSGTLKPDQLPSGAPEPAS